MKIGHARNEITPPLGVPMGGYSSRGDKGATAIESPLYADACYIEQNDLRVVLITVDLASVMESWSTPIRAEISKRLGIPTSHVLVAASHTHFGPATGEKAHDLHAGWLNALKLKLVDVACRAAAQTQDVTLSVGTGDFSRVAYNRRPVRADGTCCTAYTLPPPEENLTFRAIDPKQTVLRFNATNGQLALILVSTPMHAVVGGANFYAISPDYPGMLRHALEQVYQVPVMFAAGTAGNVVPFRRGEGCRQLIGHYLAGVALQSIEMATSGPGKLGFKQERLPVPSAVRKDPETMQAQVSAAELRLEKAETEKEKARLTDELRRAKNLANLTAKFGPGDTLDIEVTAMSFGNLGVLCLPGEILAETGLYIQARSPFPHTLVISLVNQSMSYLATRSAIWEGGYESVATWYGEESEAFITEAAIRMLHEVWECTR